MDPPGSESLLHSIKNSGEMKAELEWTGQRKVVSEFDLSGATEVSEKAETQCAQA